MKTNLIQSYITNMPQAQRYNSDKAKENFDVHKELSNRTFIKPLPSNGHLVSNNIFDAPSEIFKDFKYDIKAFKHALQGRANDHELGSLNDVGMKLGGLAIATYLFSRKSTPLTKVMEFVGFTSFFMAMDIWPKLALQLPAYLIHGFDIRQKYVDNFGTKKPVFLDHQFIPWDLYSDDEINRIGDRMRVPKDIKNRRDFIQEKMRKIALQNNTMWMLTSGFATPILSALICNALEGPVNKYQDGYFERQADELLTNFSKEAEKMYNSSYVADLSKLLEENSGKRITPELFKDIYKKLTFGLDGGVAKAVERDLGRILYAVGGFDVDESTFEGVRGILSQKFSSVGLSVSDMEKIIPSNEELLKALGDLSEPKTGASDFSQYIREILKLVDTKVEAFAASCANPELVEDIRFISKSLPHSKDVLESPQLSQIFRKVPSAVLTPELVSNLKQIAQSFETYKARLAVLDKYAYIKAAQAPETLLANRWNELSSGLLKTFGITDIEAAQVRFDRELAAKLLRTKFDAIASDDKLYGEVVDDILKKLSELMNKTSFGDIDVYNSNPDNLYQQKVEVTFQNIERELRESKMFTALKRLVGYYREDPHSAKSMQLAFVSDRVRGVRSSFYRLLNTLDMYRRVAKLENIDGALSGINVRSMKEEIIDMCKELLLSGHCSDYSVKFNYPVNMNLNPENLTPEQWKEFFSPLESKGGVLVNKFLHKIPTEELADNSYDKRFYEAAMKLMYGSEVHGDTISRLNDFPKLRDDFMQYRRNLYNAFGGDRYFAKPWHKLKDAVGGATSEFKFNILACAPDEMFHKLCSQKYNGNKWLKMFVATGSTVLALTVLSQLFMGHMSNDKIKEGK